MFLQALRFNPFPVRQLGAAAARAAHLSPIWCYYGLL
jgi:hypothetical protein